MVLGSKKKGRMEKLKQKKSDSFGHVSSLLNTLRSAQGQAQEVITESEEMIEELEQDKADAQEVKEFSEKMLAEWNQGGDE